MEKVNKVLLMMIAMAAIMLAAVGIDKGIQVYDNWKWESERLVRYEQTHADVADMQVAIRELSQDQDAITAFIEENREYFDEAVFSTEGTQTFLQENEPGMDLALAENMADENQDAARNEPGENQDISENELDESVGVSGNGHDESFEVSGNGLGESMTVSGNGLGESMTVSGNGLGENMEVSGNGLGESMDVSGNWPGENMDISGNGLDGNMTVSENEIGGEGSAGVSGNTLLERRRIRGSYMETQMQNEADKAVIESNSFDFSDISIACLGDSITEAANLSSMEDYHQYSYPARLKELLGAKSVTNLGIGGSSIGRYWENAFVDRYREIPEDTDLIIVMGGTNDGFCMSEKDIGSMEERKRETFIGDLDELMRGLVENYPDADIVFVTPLPNVLHDMLRKERDYLMPQSVLVDVMIQLATEYDIPVIDLYNSNILDSHDAAVIYNYMPDGVHCNSNGYSVLAEHLAAELVRLYGGDVQEEQE